MTLTFRCGHPATVSAMAPSTPQCAVCGERTVTRVTDAAPAFRGRVHGPHSYFAPLDAAPMRLYEGE